MNRARVAVLISGRGSNLQALLDAAAMDSYPAEIALVVSNNPAAAGLALAAAQGVQTSVINHKDYGRGEAARKPFDEAIDAMLGKARIDFVCLAGFMRLLSEPFVQKWRGKLINIHPSLLPSFKGLNVHQRMIDAGVKIAGCTVHFVSSEMDGGPVIGQAAVPVFAGDDASSLAARILEAEHRLYRVCLEALAEGRVRLTPDGRVLIANPTKAPASWDTLINLG